MPRAVDASVLERAVGRFRERHRASHPRAARGPEHVLRPCDTAALGGVEPDAAHPRQPVRGIHWYNGADRRSRVPVPGTSSCRSALTGVEARIVVALGDRFPMIGAHKVLAAYGCLVPRIVSGGFDPTQQRAVWPSTGNYCRGGVAISRIMGCRGVAVLPRG